VSYVTQNRCVSHKYYVVNLPSDVKDSIVYPENELERIDIFSVQILELCVVEPSAKC